MIVTIFSLLLNYVKLTFLLAHFDWIPVLKIKLWCGSRLASGSVCDISNSDAILVRRLRGSLH